jgi:hypothetical protein
MTASGDRFWIFAAAYVAVAAEAGIASLLSKQKRDRAFWLATSIALLVFAAAKEFQFQGQLTNWLRTDARAHHLYGFRAFVQYPFLALVLVGAMIFVRRFRHWLKMQTRSIAIAAVTMIALLAFMLVRAASAHALDGLSTIRIAGVRSGWWVEIAGLTAIALAAGLFLLEQARARQA